jgi:hypothetical protein
MTLNYSHYLRVTVPYVHLQPEYRPQIDVSLPPEEDLIFLTYCALSGNMSQFDFGEFPHHPLETILNDRTSRNPVDSNHVSEDSEVPEFKSRTGSMKFPWVSSVV